MKLCVRYGGCCGVREERLLRKEGVGGGGAMLFESRPWYGKWKIGGVQVDLQSTSGSDWWFCTT